jgi:hypothetical protein
MLIFNIKIDKDTTGNYLALEKAFFLRINRPGTQETTKQDSENGNEVKVTACEYLTVYD